ncbi:acyl-[acyl-carrier-protein]--UDP-N-acetylglucosamine O-acyltransferase [Thiosulfatimonas sediminis]|uniref:Acyl-[acyl-carrier-protein]--UDP-N-acetylglucosamine O-acyltransferase n=1 Tax=Thiosulfatimonas sediminis TaxID=2675054 RepID=A0A6F8PUU2_9GAMM|nr:acyl-ACP--UDP-N-acetylglucosamine O-acyltransferase [Thiosulfatimonas sediminis]BBP45903.1 acyl-[acyl-carrier-protein]--UDP-N-acetylglucosamine O-acyltransferase [Thiosulfatimonas sediminis]
MIHPTAIIDAQARIAADVEIGPFCVIEGDVVIDSGSKLDSHVVVSGPTRIGKNNRFYPFGSIGAAPQDKKYAGEPTMLIIGDNNTFRENVTLNRGTVQDIAKTVIGNDNWIMAGVHIAHDCIVGNHCIMANNVALAGHVEVQDWAILGGYTLVHQFCRIGEHAFCGMGSVINQDVPDFVVVSGNIAEAKSVNLEGLKRRNFDSVQRTLVKRAFKIIYRNQLSIKAAISELQAQNDEKGTLDHLIAFLESSTRGITR